MGGALACQTLRIPVIDHFLENVEKNSHGVFKTFSSRHMISHAPRRPGRDHKRIIHHWRIIEMTRRRTLAWFLLMALLSTAAALAQTKPAGKTTNDPGKKEWIQLFNGKDLKDWAPKINGYDLNDNFGNTF